MIDRESRISLQSVLNARADARAKAIEDCIREVERHTAAYADGLGRRHAKTIAAANIVEALRLLAKG